MGGCAERSLMKNAYRYLSNLPSIGKEGGRKPASFYFGPFCLPLILLPGHADC